MQPTGAQLRVVDPVITDIARGYRSPGDSIADVLFPRVTVGSRAGLILVFGKEDFQLVNSMRAPGANTKRVQFGYGKGNYSLVDFRLEGMVPVENQEEAARGAPGINLGAMAVRRVQNVMGNEREKQAADLARNAALYPTGNKATLSGTSQWSDPASNPVKDVNDAKEQIRSQIGQRPNTLVVGPKVLTALRNHPSVLASLSDQNDKVPATLEQLARIFELDRIVEGQGIYADGLGAPFTDMWGKDAILAFTTPGSANDYGSPSYGYTYQLAGRPFAERPYYEPNPNSWLYPYTDARQPVIAGASAGFLFQNAVA